jgi:hypothetical protein
MLDLNLKVAFTVYSAFLRQRAKGVFTHPLPAFLYFLKRKKSMLNSI